MTPYGLVASLAWTACAVFLILKSDTHVRRWLDAQLRGMDPPVEIPDDLLAVAMAETEEWAQTQSLKAIRQKYDELGANGDETWNKVRAAVGVATMHRVA